MRRLNLRLVDAAWLLALAIYILAGMRLASFHGDESIHIYTSRDYVTAFIDHNPASLIVNPPYYIDDDPWLRILNGSVNRYTIGLSLHLAGLTSSAALPRPGWDWGLDYDTDVATGHLPSDVLLAAARLPSTLFLILSAFAMFAIGWQFGERLPAYFISGLYALNPVILLNGRRAMMEGSLLGFGLLTMWLAILIVRGRTRWYWWVVLTVSCGLTLDSKHNGLVFVGGALGWIALTEIIRFLKPSPESLPGKSLGYLSLVIVKLIASGICTVLIFIALSPALWNDPIVRFGNLVEQRQMLLEIQVAADANAPTTLIQRIEGILTQPFLTAPMHYEVSFWANAKDITAEIARYMASPSSGLQFGLLLGIPLTLLAGWGIIIALSRRRSWEIGLILWLAITVASLMVNPLPWQRYYLPLLPVATVLVGVALVDLIQRIQAARLKST